MNDIRSSSFRANKMDIFLILIRYSSPSWYYNLYLGTMKVYENDNESKTSI